MDKGKRNDRPSLMHQDTRSFFPLLLSSICLSLWGVYFAFVFSAAKITLITCLLYLWPLWILLQGYKNQACCCDCNGREFGEKAYFSLSITQTSPSLVPLYSNVFEFHVLKSMHLTYHRREVSFLPFLTRSHNLLWAEMTHFLWPLTPLMSRSETIWSESMLWEQFAVGFWYFQL